MSDCFDHELDAYESQEQSYLQGDDTYNRGGGGYRRSHRLPDPLHFHDFYRDVKFEAFTEKAYLIQFKSGDKCWVAKSLCRNKTKDSVCIWRGATLKPIKEK